MPVVSPLTLACRAMIVSLAVAAAAPAASNTWNPAIGDGSWNDLSNWTNPASVPGPGDMAIFNTVAGTTPTTPHTVTVPTPITVADLTIMRTGMTLDVPVGSSLTVTRPGGLGNPSTNGLYLNGGTLNAAGTVVANGFNFSAGRVNGTVQFPADAVGALLVPADTASVGTFLFNGRGEVGRGKIVAGINITARQVDAATPGTLSLFKGAFGTTSTFDSDVNYGTITLDSTATIADSSVTLTTSLNNPLSPITNYGTINLNAGAAITNTRTVVGTLINNAPATLNVASGVTASVSNNVNNFGRVNVAGGASLTAAAFGNLNNAVTQIDGTLITPNFGYTGGTVSGTVNIAGTPITGNRRLTLAVANPTADSTFVFHGGGEMSNSNNNAVPQRVTIVGQPVNGAPAADLRLLGTTFNNYGTITLAGNGVPESAVSLTVAPTGSTTPGSLYNYNTVNLNAGGSGTNTRTVNGTLFNYLGGKLNVATGVTANLVQGLSNDGALTVASGASLKAGLFYQGSGGVTTINGTLTSPEVNYSYGTINGTIELAGSNSTGTRLLTLGTSMGPSVGTSSFVFQGGGTLTAANGLPQPVTITARAIPTITDASLRITGTTLSNYGTLTLAADAATNNATVRISSSTQTASVYNYGTLNLDAGGGGANNRVIQGSLFNYNNGVTNVAAGVAASVTQNLNNDGTLTIAAGGALKPQAFTQTSTNAVTTINGSLTAPDVTYTNGVINGTVTVDGTNASNTRQLTLGSPVGTSSFVIRGGGTLSASYGLAPAVTLNARATNIRPNSTLKYIGSTLGNYGTLTLDAEANSVNSLVSLSPSTGSGSVYNYRTLNFNAGGQGTNGRSISGALFNYQSATTNIAAGVTATVEQVLNNDGILNIAAGATLTAGQFSQTNSNAVTTLNGKLTAADVNFTGGAINGTVYLDGKNATGTRQLTLGGTVGTSSFVLMGGGTLSANSFLAAAATVEARATRDLYLSTLKYTGSSLNNYGTLTLDAAADVEDSTVNLDSGTPSPSVYNNGTINFNATGAYTNTRRIYGLFTNYAPGRLNVATGARGYVTLALTNNGQITVAPVATLQVPQFSQFTAGAVTTVNGFLYAADVNFQGGQVVGEITLLGTNPAGTRSLTVGDNPNMGAATFALRGGGGEVYFGNGKLRSGVAVVGRATPDLPLVSVKLAGGNTLTNYGTLTLEAEPLATNSQISLTLPMSNGAYGWLYNSGTINFNAGGAGTNTRSLSATLNNNPGGTVNVNADTTFNHTVYNRGVMNLNAPATFREVFNNEIGATLNLNVTPAFQAAFNNYGTLNVAPPAPPAGGGTPAPVEVPYAIGGNGDFTQSGSGTVILSGANTYTGETSVTNPAATLVATPAAYQNVLTNAGGLDVAAGAFVFQYDTAAPAPAAIAKALRRAAAASAPSPVETIRGLLVAGHASDFAAGQIRSSTASDLRGLGYVDDRDSVTLRATFYGDADLDGGVSINDFNTLAIHFGNPGAWATGDFDYDGSVSINDFNLLAATFGRSLTGPAAAVDYSGLLAFAAAHNDLVAFEAVTGVPEPTGLVATAMAAGAFASRRRRCV